MANWIEENVLVSDEPISQRKVGRVGKECIRKVHGLACFDGIGINERVPGNE